MASAPCPKQPPTPPQNLGGSRMRTRSHTFTPNGRSRVRAKLKENHVFGFSDSKPLAKSQNLLGPFRDRAWQRGCRLCRLYPLHPSCRQGIPLQARTFGSNNRKPRAEPPSRSIRHPRSAVLIRRTAFSKPSLPNLPKLGPTLEK